MGDNKKKNILIAYLVFKFWYLFPNHIYTLKYFTLVLIYVKLFQKGSYCPMLYGKY